MRVLVVDHQIVERERLVSLLQAMNDIDVVGVAETCSEAITKARDLKPNLILLEIKLPDGSGLEVMRDIFSVSPEVKIVILTIYESEEFLLQAIRNGARGYLIKDAWFESMVSGLHRLDQDEFFISPKMAQTVFMDYSRIKVAFDQRLEIETLTARELDVLRLICIGSSNREIARNLVIAENTVRVHIHSILRKLNLKNRREAREKYRVLFDQNYSFYDLLPPPSSSGGTQYSRK